MTKKPTGRPSSFTQKMADRICERMSAGESLRDICKDPAMPDKQTVLRWVEARESFRDQYARARESLVDHWAEEIVAEANNDKGDTDKDGRGNNANVQRSRLKIDTLKWLMSKIAPRKYGDFNRQEISGPNGGPQYSVNWQTIERKIIDPGFNKIELVGVRPPEPVVPQITYTPPAPEDLTQAAWRRLMLITGLLEQHTPAGEDPPHELLMAIEATIREFKRDAPMQHTDATKAESVA